MSNEPLTSRRQLLKVTGGVAAATALSGFKFPTIHANGSDEIHVALVGCGGRGSGAAVNAMMTKKQGAIKLVAMADVFKDRLDSSFKNVGQEIGDQMDVPDERKFIGFDAYKHAMDALRPGDVVILTTPPAFRWVHFTYAISKKLNVFMEKPVTVDGPTSRRMLRLGEDATAANLKVGVGLMGRHAPNLIELHDRIQRGQLGEILLMRGYRMHGPAGTFESLPKPDNISHLHYQIRRFHSFLWASGGNYNDFYIHHIDHLSWFKNAWPVSAQALGGRHYKESSDGRMFVDQNFDTYSVEYTYADGTKMYFDGRCVEGAAGIYSSFVHGTKGSAIAAKANDYNGPSSIYKNQTMTGSPSWISTDNSNPYQNEWETLISAIRHNKPYNEVKRGVEASVASSMGRMAAHTAQIVTFDDMLNCDHEFGVGIDQLTDTSDSPLMPGANGRYPQPTPGMNKHEY